VTQPVWTHALIAGSNTIPTIRLNAYVLLVAPAGATIVLPSSQPDGTWLVVRVSGNPVTYNGTTIAVNTTASFLIFTAGTWVTLS
jgi:hypothetical protein